MKTKITRKTETTIEISKADVLAMLRKKFPDIPNDFYFSHIESDDGSEVVGLEITYDETK